MLSTIKKIAYPTITLENANMETETKDLAQQAPNKYRSEQIGALIVALGKAQASYKTLIANEDGPRGKFANLQAILAATKESLAANALGFYQHVELLDEGAGATILWTMLGHETDQFIASCARIILGKTDRETGNTLEIHKRLHALMILGIAPSSSDPVAFDDGGILQAENHLIETLRKPKEPVKEKIDYNDVVNNEQYNELLIELEGYSEITKDIMQYYDIETLANLPRSEYHKALAKVRKIKRTAEEYNNRAKNG